MGCQATFKEHCQYPKCDCDAFVFTNPAHSGKVDCYKCHGWIMEGDEIGYLDHQHSIEFPSIHFHKWCFNPYEHYYGLNKPID